MVTDAFCQIEESIFLRLTGVHRFSHRTFITSDTDADHTVRAQLIILEMWAELTSRGMVFDVKEACWKALIHDLDEVVSCDIPRDIKYHDSKITKEIKRVTNELLLSGGLPKNLLSEIMSAKEGPEGLVLQIVDVLDALMTLLKEARLQQSKKLIEDSKESVSYLIKISDSIENQILKDYVKELIVGAQKRIKKIESQVY